LKKTMKKKVKKILKQVGDGLLVADALEVVVVALFAATEFTSTTPSYGNTCTPTTPTAIRHDTT
jgi:hypothetical protein